MANTPQQNIDQAKARQFILENIDKTSGATRTTVLNAIAGWTTGYQLSPFEKAKKAIFDSNSTTQEKLDALNALLVIAANEVP